MLHQSVLFLFVGFSFVAQPHLMEHSDPRSGSGDRGPPRIQSSQSAQQSGTRQRFANGEAASLEGREGNQNLKPARLSMLMGIETVGVLITILG